jgi:hypothetical protein
MGNKDSEAQLRYEDRARLRMEARRKELADKKSGEVVGESRDGEAAPEYQQWRMARIAEYLKDGIKIPATDHSTIVTNAMHAERAMSYDVAVGVCKLTDEDWRNLRVEADWRYSSMLKDSHPNLYLSEYFAEGYMSKQQLAEWVKQYNDARMPDKIIDQRSWKRTVGARDQV